MLLTAVSSESDPFISDSHHRRNSFEGLALLLRNGADSADLLLSAPSPMGISGAAVEQEPFAEGGCR